MARPGRDSALDQETFHDWLMRHGQTAETINRFWNLITLPALNDDIRDVSADAGIMLFQVALLGPPANAAIGYPVVGLSRLSGEAARGFIEERGGEVRTGADVAELMLGGEVGVRLADGALEKADAVISAVPAATLIDLLGGRADGEFFAPASGMQTSPIVGVHIWYDRPVMDDMFVATLGGSLQWVFNVTGMHGDDEVSGQHVAISLSGAWKWKDKSKREFQDIFVAEMAATFPRAADAKVERFLVVKMLDATFRVTPGSLSRRLPQETPVPGLFLAGDWTRTGWPSTMEGAVRSGNLAADAVDRFLPEDRRE
jgi:protoporphyrinogen oxidase